jgi:hypothetical protein
LKVLLEKENMSKDRKKSGLLGCQEVR